LLENKSLVIENFDTFTTKFQVNFNDTYSVQIAIHKIGKLCQGHQLASMYIADFRLLAIDGPIQSKIDGPILIIE
jgi:hypothetical protein